MTLYVTCLSALPMMDLMETIRDKLLSEATEHVGRVLATPNVYEARLERLAFAVNRRELVRNWADTDMRWVLRHRITACDRRGVGFILKQLDYSSRLRAVAGYEEFLRYAVRLETDAYSLWVWHSAVYSLLETPEDRLKRKRTVISAKVRTDRTCGVARKISSFASASAPWTRKSAHAQV